ncbi:MAG TPA: LysE family translocator [Steroidobacteraceae bacterium]|nr:LysE family translocator [Steroidobacteraceae bacterium]
MADLLPLATYSFVMSITPGPNNVMLTASGATFGFRRTLPALLGVWAGHTTQTLACCIGLGVLFTRWPILHEVLRWAGAAYLLYLGWRLLGSGGPRDGSAPKPVSFLEAALFQAVNPKAWVMSLTTAAVFLPSGVSLPVACAYVAGMMLVVNLPSITVWALFGSSLRRWLTLPSRRRAFNGIMAFGLVATGLVMVV